MNFSYIEELNDCIKMYFRGDEEKVKFIPQVITALTQCCYMEEIAPIIVEILNDDPLIRQLIEIYESGNNLWFALNPNNAMGRYDPTRQVVSSWSIGDVKGLRKDLTNEQALLVLQKAYDKMDATVGINWDVLEYWADELYPNADYNEDDYDETKADYRYDIYDKDNYIIDDNYAVLDSAIEEALKGDGVVVRRAWYHLDEHGNTDFDRKIKDVEMWVRDGWKFDGERFVEV